MKKILSFLILMCAMSGCQNVPPSGPHQSIVNKYRYATPPSDGVKVTYHKRTYH